jgi:sulfonate transport system ATP-binding protein
MENKLTDSKVQVINLTKCFGDLTVLKDVSFNIKKGEFVCIVGPTGCGKTTFLNLLTKLIEPTSGEILIDGEPADPQKHNLAFVFQEPSALPWLTAEQNIRFGLEVKKHKSDYIKSQVDKIISLLGLEKFRNVYPHEMSVSMEQRIVIGRAFAMNPDLLLMDEPYGQMDIKVRYFLEDEVIKLWKETGCTVLFITHNLEESVYLAERVLILSQKPATVKTEIQVDLPRPRNLSDPKFIAIRKEITDMIRWW